MTALVVAVGGVAIAADGGFVNDEGLIQGCVAEKNIVNSLTDPVIGGLSHVITPQGALLVPKPGEDCPAGSKALSFASNALPKVFASEPAKPTELSKGKAEIAGAMLDAGDHVVNATAVISNPGFSNAQTIKCALVGSDGKTITGTTSTATVPAGSENARLTLPITAIVSDVPAGELTLQCKNVVSEIASAIGAPSARAAGCALRAATTKAPERPSRLRNARSRAELHARSSEMTRAQKGPSAPTPTTAAARSPALPSITIGPSRIRQSHGERPGNQVANRNQVVVAGLRARPRRCGSRPAGSAEKAYEVGV